MWVLRNRDLRHIQSAEISFLRGLNGVSRLDRVKNGNIRKVLNTSSVEKKIHDYRIKWLDNLLRTNEDQVPYASFVLHTYL